MGFICLKAADLLWVDSLLSQLCPQEYLVHISSTSEGWKAKSTLELYIGFDPGSLRFEIQCLNH